MKKKGFQPLSNQIKLLYLASSSPRRHDILNQFNICFEAIQNKLGDEPSYDFSCSPRHYVKQLATQKALCSAKDIHGWVLSADTIVTYQENIYGKPKDHHDNVQMLTTFSNQTHAVITAFCLTNMQIKKRVVRSKKCLVTFNELSKKDIEHYIKESMPFDKAGGYGIQDIPPHFIKKIDGDRFTIMGLPIHLLKKELKRIQYI